MIFPRILLTAGLISVLSGCGYEKVTAHRFSPQGKPLLAVTYERQGVDIAVEEVHLERPELLGPEGEILSPRLTLKIKGLVNKDRTADVAGKGFDAVGKLADKLPALPVP